MTINDEKRNKSQWTRSNRSTDDLDPHTLYEILRQRNPTPPEIDLLMEKGNSSHNYSSVSLTNFESSMSRVIQRRRKDLQSFALLEANNQYTPPTKSGVDNGTITS